MDVFHSPMILDHLNFSVGATGLLLETEIFHLTPCSEHPRSVQAVTSMSLAVLASSPQACQRPQQGIFEE